MSKTPRSTEERHHELTTPWRVVLAVATLLLATTTLWYLAGPRQVRAAAPECVPGTDCTVLISAPVDAVIVSALLLLTALCALMAITGIVFTPTIGGNGLDPLPRRAKKVRKFPKGATRIVAAPLADGDEQDPQDPQNPSGPQQPPGTPDQQGPQDPLDPEDQQVQKRPEDPEHQEHQKDQEDLQVQYVNAQGIIKLGPIEPLILWDTLPAGLQKPVTDYAVENLGMLPADVPMGIREIAVTGSGAEQPYYVRLEADGKDSILKLS